MFWSTDWAAKSPFGPAKSALASRRWETTSPSMRDDASDSARSSWRARVDFVVGDGHN
jgi:hypothetical protein